MDEDGEDEPTTVMKDWDDLQLYQDLRALGWLPDFLSRTVGHVLYENIQQYTVQHIQGNYSENELLESLMDWKNSVLLPWVQDMLDISHQPNALSDWTCKLEYAIMESFCNARKAEIFDMIADYPDSTPAVRELAAILIKTRMQRTIGLALTQAYRHRLLHPGAQTSQILQVYMNSIQVLRLMDPTDALVESVTGDLTAYLRRRSDTVRCIVSR
jgi:anaphase-promoting complex subunit 2